jgi:membrane-associated protein
MTQLLTAMATPVWAYLALFGFLTVDAMVPVVPIQAIMITTGALTVYGNLSLPLVILIGTLGMFAGDSIAFLLGRSTGNVGRNWLGRLRSRFAPRHDDRPPKEESRTRRAAERFTRGLRRPGPLVLLLCRFVPGGRMAAGFHAGRTGYPLKLFALYDGAAAISWATYGGLVGHVGGTAITQSAWRLFAIAATAAIVFGTAGWILALFGGRKEAEELTGGRTAAAFSGGKSPAAFSGGDKGGYESEAHSGGTDAEELGALEAVAPEVALAAAAGAADAKAEVTAVRAASADAPLPRSTPTTTGR